VKSINRDNRSNKKIKFASAKERSRHASADVYRSHKRKIGATSAATREDAVHNPHRELGSRKRQRAHHLAVDDSRSKAAIVPVGDAPSDLVVDDVDLATEGLTLNVESSLADELDETLDRNASEVFGKFHRKVWPLVRSLPEILHHTEKIIDLMLSHMLSPESTPEVPTDPASMKDSEKKQPRGYVVNHATLDILHLMTVLARDLRHEIHPYLDRILHRIIQDLLNPPPPPPESGKQPIPLDVTLVETAFRCMSYIFKYDGDKIVENIEAMRRYYGATLAARRELVRRLASQAFAPLIRKLKNQNDRQQHIKRVMKALVAATETQPLTPLLKRTQADAVDGISQLIFQVVRGVSGQLHSQGISTIHYILTYCAKSPASPLENGNTLMVTLASDLIERISRHLADEPKLNFIGMLAGILSKSCSEAVVSQTAVPQALNALILFSKAATLHLGANGSIPTTENISILCEALESVFVEQVFSRLSSTQRVDVMSVVCPILLALQDSHRLEICLQRCFQTAFPLNSSVHNNPGDETESVRGLTSVLSRDLLPYLKSQACLRILGTAVLSAAAHLHKLDADSALLTVFAIACKQSAGKESEFMSSSRLFDDGSATSYKLPREVQDVLVKICLAACEGNTWDKHRLDRLLVSLRCIPFVVSLNSNNSSPKQQKELFKTTSSVFCDVFVKIGKSSLCNGARLNPEDLLVAQGLCLEAASQLAKDFLAGSGDELTVRKTVGRLLQPVDELLFSKASSLWIIRGVAAFTSLLRKVDLQLNDKLDATFETLIVNLSSPSHELRLHTLEILTSYPAKNFVADHADLDLDDDLDEEPSYRPSDENRGTSRLPIGKCVLIDVLLQIESMKIQLIMERDLLGLVSKVEVLGRTGRLPVIYAEAAAHHMLGLFHVKFAPLWPVVDKALTALTEGHENSVWPALETVLVTTMKAQSLQDDEYGDTGSGDQSISFEAHRLACLLWEESLGRVVTIFGEPPVVRDGEVHRHLTTDKTTFMESVWGVGEKCQQLVAKHSRVIVPSFVEFLTSQYFVYHGDDPCARELGLNIPPSESRYASISC